MDSILSEIIFRICKWRLLKKNMTISDYSIAHDNSIAEIQRKKLKIAAFWASTFSKFVDFHDKIVVDFGCGMGYISRYYQKHLGAEKVYGVERFKPHTGEDLDKLFGKIEVVVSVDKEIPLPDNHVDIITSNDVWEHVMDTRAVLSELSRILKPGGYILTHVCSWYYPLAAHMEHIIPIPWFHLFLPRKTALLVAARIYDSDWYRLANFDKTSDGQKKPNPYDGIHDYNPAYLNKITLKEYFRDCQWAEKELGLVVKKTEYLDFRGRGHKIAKFMNIFKAWPIVREFLGGGLICLQQKVK